MRYLLLLLIIKSSFAIDIFPISKISEFPAREAVFSLETYNAVELTLDCSSFLHGINIKRTQGNAFFFLYESECYQILNDLHTWTYAGEEACLKLDFVGKDWTLEKKVDDCREAFDSKPL
jgi:hypothetical protein